MSRSESARRLTDIVSEQSGESGLVCHPVGESCVIMHAGTCVHESLLHRGTDSTRFLGRGYHHEGRAPRRYDARHRGLVKMELSGAARPAQGSSEGMADGDHGCDALATINLFHFPIVSRARALRGLRQPVSTCKSTSDPRADGLALCVLHAWCTRIFTAAPPSPLRPFGLQERGRWTRSKYEASVDVPLLSPP